MLLDDIYYVLEFLLKPLYMDADIVLSAEVSESTIKGTFKDLHPYASRLIPKWYANKNDIRKLCFP